MASVDCNLGDRSRGNRRTRAAALCGGSSVESVRAEFGRQLCAHVGHSGGAVSIRIAECPLSGPPPELPDVCNDRCSGPPAEALFLGFRQHSGPFSWQVVIARAGS